MNDKPYWTDENVTPGVTITGPRNHKYEVGQVLYRLGETRVKILEKMRNAFDEPIYRIEEVYKGIVETKILAREDELKPQRRR